MGELGHPEVQIGKPAVERERIAVLNLLHGPPHHLVVKRLVVDRLDDRQLTRERYQTECAGARDEEPRGEMPPGVSAPWCDGNCRGRSAHAARLWPYRPDQCALTPYAGLRLSISGVWQRDRPCGARRATAGSSGRRRRRRRCRPREATMPGWGERDCLPSLPRLRWLTLAHQRETQVEPCRRKRRLQRNHPAVQDRGAQRIGAGRVHSKVEKCVGEGGVDDQRGLVLRDSCCSAALLIEHSAEVVVSDHVAAVDVNRLLVITRRGRKIVRELRFEPLRHERCRSLCRRRRGGPASRDAREHRRERQCRQRVLPQRNHAPWERRRCAAAVMRCSQFGVHQIEIFERWPGPPRHLCTTPCQGRDVPEPLRSVQ